MVTPCTVKTCDLSTEADMISTGAEDMECVGTNELGCQERS
jgi:hypothetical protein